MKKITRHEFWLIVLSTLLLSGCGFHLVNPQHEKLPITSVYIKANDPYNPFINRLRAEFKEHQVSVVKTPQQSPFMLVIQRLSLEQAAVGMGAETDYSGVQMIYTLKYQFWNREKNKMLFAGDVITKSTPAFSRTPLAGTLTYQPPEENLQDETIETLLTELQFKLTRSLSS